MIPDDLATWRRLLEEGRDNPWSESLRLLEDGEQPGVLDTSYLTPDDLANPDIAANVQAIADTAALITWIADDEDESKSFGYWRGPNDLPLSEAPIVEHDSEGQFYVLEGSTLSEALCIEYGEWSDDGYEGLAALCRAEGMNVPEDKSAITTPTASPTPAEHHHAGYERLKAQA